MADGHVLTQIDDLKDGLLTAINRVIDDRAWTQQQTAAILRATQSRVSELQRRKHRQFSIDKLLEYAAILGITVTYQVGGE